MSRSLGGVRVLWTTQFPRPAVSHFPASDPSKDKASTKTKTEERGRGSGMEEAVVWLANSDSHIHVKSVTFLCASLHYARKSRKAHFRLDHRQTLRLLQRRAQPIEMKWKQK